jgi:hypothetical protein
VILNINYTRRDSAASTSSEVVTTFLSLLEEKQITPSQFAHLHIYLDWLQYKENFREPVSVVQSAEGEEGGEKSSSRMDVRIDTRQIAPGTLRGTVEQAICPAKRESCSRADRIYLEEFGSFRASIAWDFNRLYWQRLKDWESVTGKSYEKELPGGSSDGHQPQAIADSVERFWTVLSELDKQSRLPQEAFVLEIGVGLAKRAALWLDDFCALDQQRGTNYYPRIRFLLADYSLASLERSRPAVQKHLELCSFIALDALDPTRTLSFLRHKILYVHSSNMYDNLPDEEVVWRDNRIYWVQTRAYVSKMEAERIAHECDISPNDVPRMIHRLLEVGAEALPDRQKGMAFWMQIWKAMRLEEKLVDLVDLPEATFPAGLSSAHMEDILKDAPSDLRFHLSSGALESFRNTLPLLHPRGYLQVQDIFVTDLHEYCMGFYGPGKLGGSIVNWVNGALVREVAERGGYDVHFVPFPYRAGSKTSTLYTTRRE